MEEFFKLDMSEPITQVIDLPRPESVRRQFLAHIGFGLHPAVFLVTLDTPPPLMVNHAQYEQLRLLGHDFNKHPAEVFSQFECSNHYVKNIEFPNIVDNHVEKGRDGKPVTVKSKFYDHYYSGNHGSKKRNQKGDKQQLRQIHRR